MNIENSRRWNRLFLMESLQTTLIALVIGVVAVAVGHFSMGFVMVDFVRLSSVLRLMERNRYVMLEMVIEIVAVIESKSFDLLL